MTHFSSAAISSLPLLLVSLTTPGVHFASAEGIGGGLRNTREAAEKGKVDSDYWLPQIADLGLKCIDNSIRAGGGKPLYWCIEDGEALCIDYDHHPFGGRWTFGIKDREIKLWNPKNEEVWKWCTEASRICIGEEHGYKKGRHSVERPYMIFYDDKKHRTVGNLTCDGTDGKNDRNIGQSTILKLVDNAELSKYVDYPVTIVKFKKGMTEDPNDDNSLWNITFNPWDPKIDYWDDNATTPGMWNYNKHKCEWNDECPSNAPSQVPSSQPSMQPSDVPSSQPSSAPSQMPSNDCEAKVNITCVGTNTDGDVQECFRIPTFGLGMPSKWTLQWNYTITNDCDKSSTLEKLDSTICHDMCTNHMSNAMCMGALGLSSSFECTDISIVNMTFESDSREILPGGTISAMYLDWTNVDLAMEGADVFGNVTATLKTDDGRERTAEPSKECVEPSLCCKQMSPPPACSPP